MRATTFKTRATEHVAQRRRSQPNCLRSHDTSTELVFGRIAPRTCNRTRGFLVRDNKTTATVSGASVAWTGIGRCRTSPQMLSTDITISGQNRPSRQYRLDQNRLSHPLHHPTLHYTTLKERMIAYSNNDSIYHLIAEGGLVRGGGVDV